MTVHFDDKGKYFTEVISKEKVQVLLQTDSHMIRGFIHARHNQRLKDELNTNEQFIAITDAEILDEQDEVLHSTSFIAINRDKIIWIMPRIPPENVEDHSQEENDG